MYICMFICMYMYFIADQQRQHRTLHVQKDVLPHVLRYSLCPVSAALAVISRMDSISTSYKNPQEICVRDPPHALRLTHHTRERAYQG